MANPWQGIRSRMAGWMGGQWNAAGYRDLYAQFGYPRSITAEMYWDMYLRNGIAARVVRAFPASTWREQPVVRDEEGDSDAQGKPNYSAFVDSVNQHMKKFRVMQYLERADRLSSIGQFGVLYMGFADGLTPSQPVGLGKNDLLYLAAYGQPNLLISGWETDITNPRFGMANSYTCMTGTGTRNQLLAVRRSFQANWSRTIHVAEQLDSDEVYSTPRLMPVFNWLKDLEKTMGSSSESFWLNARGGLVLSADKDAKLDPTGIADMKDQMALYQEQITRSLALQGTTAQLLQTTVANPMPNIDKLMDLIAGASGIPKRILSGSERSDLSSTQDEQNYSSKIGERQTGWAGPSLLQVYVQKMIDTGNIVAPKGAWWIEWPDTNALGPAAQADIALKRAQALGAYVNGIGSDLVVPTSEFRSEFLGLMSEPDEAYGSPEEQPEDEDNPEVQSQFGITGVTEEGPVQDTALSGIQITALMGIVEALIAKEMPLETAVALVLISFPEIEEATARALLQPAADFEAPPPPEPPALPAPGTVAQPGATKPAPPLPTAKDIAVKTAVAVARKLRKNSAPRTLYVSRKVVNAADIRAHYVAQGIDTMVPAEEMHVTIAYSTAALDWTKVPDDWATYSPDRTGNLPLQPGGMRQHDMFGEDKDALVLLFTSSDLAWRWGTFREAGASWSWGEYTPHITITYAVTDGLQVDSIKPWQGAITLGPELWTTVQTDWSDDLVENRRLAP